MMQDHPLLVLDQVYIKRMDKFIKELVWMAKVLRYGRENVPREK